MNVLLHSVAPIDGRADLRKHPVPRPTHLCVKVATQRLGIFVQLPVVISGTHAQMCRTIQVISETNGQRASSCRDEAARRSLCTYQGAWMKSGELQTRSHAEYIDEIADQSTTVRITEMGPRLPRVADAGVHRENPPEPRCRSALSVVADSSVVVAALVDTAGNGAWAEKS